MFIIPLAPRRATYPVFARASAGVPRQAPRRPAMDVAESADAYTLTFDLPGMRREQVKVDVEGDRLRVEASTASEPAGDQRVVWRERAQPGFVRELTLPDDADGATVAAKFADGVLSLTIGRRAKAGPVRVAVN